MPKKQHATRDLNGDHRVHKEEPERHNANRTALEKKLENNVSKKEHRNLTSHKTAAEGARDGKEEETNVSNSNVLKGFETHFKSPLKSDNCLGKVMSLNHSVSGFISLHVKLYPTCNLIPIFKTYEQYLKDIIMEENIKTAPKKTADNVVKLKTDVVKDSEFAAANKTAAASTTASSRVHVVSKVSKATSTIACVDKSTMTEAKKANPAKFDATSLTNKKPNTNVCSFNVKAEDKPEDASTLSCVKQTKDKTSISLTVPTFRCGEKSADAAYAPSTRVEIIFSPLETVDTINTCTTATKFSFGAKNLADTVSVWPTTPKCGFEANKSADTSNVWSAVPKFSFGAGKSTSRTSLRSTTRTFNFSSIQSANLNSSAWPTEPKIHFGETKSPNTSCARRTARKLKYEAKRLADENSTSNPAPTFNFFASTERKLNLDNSSQPNTFH